MDNYLTKDVKYLSPKAQKDLLEIELILKKAHADLREANENLTVVEKTNSSHPMIFSFNQNILQ